MRNAVQTQIALEGGEQRLAPAHGTPNDNTSEALQQLLAENVRLRTEQWPAPYNRTTHQLHLGDARGLSWIADSSVHLIVTSPPYWNLKDYNEHTGQLGHIADYERFLSELDNVWRECARVLVPGGRVCCVVGDCLHPKAKE